MHGLPAGIALIVGPLIGCAAIGAAAEAPAPETGLLQLALRSPEERSGDHDALAARWVAAIAKLGKAEADRSPPPAPSAGRAADAPPAAVPDELVLELVLRRLIDIRARLADKLGLLPAVEEASRLHYPDGLHRQLLRDILGDLYARAGRREDRLALRKGDGYLRRLAVIGPFGIGGTSQVRRPFPPESEVQPEVPCAGRKGPVSWRVPPRPPLASPRVHPSRWIYPDEGVVYLLAQVRAEARTEAVIHLGGPEPIVLWLNGRGLLAEDPGVPRDERRAVGARLEAGWNRILIKTQAAPDSWLWARIAAPGGEPIAGLAEESSDEAPAGAGKLSLHAIPQGADPRWDGPFRAGASDAWAEVVEGMAGKVPPETEADARIGLAVLLALLGDDEGAVPQAERALELRGGDAAIQAHAGEVLLAARYLPRDHARARARAAFEAALGKDPEYLPARLPIARLLLENHEAGKAAEELGAAISRRPGFFAARCQLLDLYRERGWEAEAEAEAAAIESLAPRSPVVPAFRARWYRDRKNAPRALKEARAALALDRSRANLLEEAAELCLETGDLPGAESALLERRDLDPEDPSALEALSRSFETRGELDRAIEVERELDARDPADPAPAASIGRCLELAGRLDEARGWFERALAREPGDIDVSRHLAALGKKGSRDEFWAPYDEDLEALLPGIPAEAGRAEASSASALAVLDLAVLRIHPDGSTSEYVHQAFRVLTDEAKDELSAAHTPGEVLLLRTLTADGRSLEPVAATGKEEYSLPAVAPGATVEWAYRMDRPRFQGFMVQPGGFYFQDFNCKKPFLLSRYVVLLPAGLEVDLVERALARAEDGAGAPRATVKKEEKALPGGARAVIYETREAARLEREVGMPLRDDYIPNVEVLGRRTWDDVASHLEDAVLGLTFPSAELDRAAAEAVKGLADPREKARRLHDIVGEMVAESSGPSEAVRVLVTRSGDRTALFKALLDRAGVASRWAWLRPRDALRPADDGSHPRPEAFGDRFVLVEPEGAPPAWVSLAIRRSPYGKLPADLQGGTALVLEPRGGAVFLPVPSQSLEDSASSTIAELTLSGPGIPSLGAAAVVDIVSRDLPDYGAKERLRTMKEDIKQQALSAAASRLFPGAKLVSGGFPGLGENDPPLAIRMELSAPKALAPRGEGEALLRVVLQPAEMIKRFIRRPKREHPYRLGGQLVVRDRLRIATGPLYRIERVPESRSFTSKIGTWSLVFTPEGPDGKGGERLRVERYITLLPTTVPVEEFARLVEFARAVDQAEGGRIVLMRVEPAGR